LYGVSVTHSVTSIVNLGGRVETWLSERASGGGGGGGGGGQLLSHVQQKEQFSIAGPAIIIGLVSFF